MPSAVWLRVMAAHLPGVPEQACTGRVTEPTYLYHNVWDEGEARLEPHRPSSQEGVGTRGKDKATGASRKDQSSQEEERCRLVTAASKTGERLGNGRHQAMYSSSVCAVCGAVL